MTMSQRQPAGVSRSMNSHSFQARRVPPSGLNGRSGTLQGSFFSRPAWVRHARTAVAGGRTVQAKGAMDLPGGGWASALPDSMAIPTAGGKPLPDGVRQRMESFFKTDFSDVRVHVGPHASAIGAIAFTIGSSLHFAPGQFQPDTPRGLQLIGHELAHVVQQRAGRVRNPFGQGVAVVQDHHLEAEADRLGSLAATRPVG
jgi:hypothetical protein